MEEWRNGGMEEWRRRRRRRRREEAEDGVVCIERGRTCGRMCTYARTCGCVNVIVYACWYLRVCASVELDGVCVYMYICIYVCMVACACVYVCVCPSVCTDVCIIAGPLGDSCANHLERCIYGDIASHHVPCRGQARYHHVEPLGARSTRGAHVEPLGAHDKNNFYSTRGKFGIIMSSPIGARSPAGSDRGRTCGPHGAVLQKHVAPMGPSCPRVGRQVSLPLVRRPCRPPYLMQNVHAYHLLEVLLEGHHHLPQRRERVAVVVNQDQVRVPEGLLEGRDDLLGGGRGLQMCLKRDK